MAALRRFGTEEVRACGWGASSPGWDHQKGPLFAFLVLKLRVLAGVNVAAT